MKEITIEFEDDPIEKEQFLRTLHYLAGQKNASLNLVNCPHKDAKLDFSALFYFDKKDFGISVYQSPKIIILDEYFYDKINLELSYYCKELDKIDQTFFPYLSPLIKEQERKILEDKLIRTSYSKQKVLGHLCYYQN